jgi:hypothetical protein
MRKSFRGLMSKDTFAAILDKAKTQAPALERVAMHNWTEPLLHPELPEFIALAKQRALFVYVSSNLNVLRREDDLLASGLDKLSVSVSGWDQERYGVYHRGGDIAAVKANMERLAAAKDRTGSTAQLVCIFHRYRDNRADENRMKDFAKEIGFLFAPTWAFFTPVEKILASQSARGSYGGVEFNAQDQAIAERLAVPIRARLEVARAYGAAPCKPLTIQFPVDASGHVRLCCATGFFGDNRIAHFFDVSLEEIQERREAHPLCRDCGACRIPDYYFCNGEDLDEIGNLARDRWDRCEAEVGAEDGEDAIPLG